MWGWVAFLAPFLFKVDKAQESSSLSAPRNGSQEHPSQRGGGGAQDDEQGGRLPGGGVEPRLAKLEDGGGGGGGGEAGPHHPSSAVARDSYARTRSTGERGRDAAACLLQSRYRGYRLRKYGGAGGVVSGTSSEQEEGGEERQHDALRPAPGSVVDAKCSVLDLEVRYSTALHAGKTSGEKYRIYHHTQDNAQTQTHPGGINSRIDPPP